MTKQPGYKKRRLKPTKFIRLWGIDPQDMAKQEQLTTDALHMRVMLFGTPYQRKAKPNNMEMITGRTAHELCERMNLNRKTIFSRFAQFTDPFRIPRSYTVRDDLDYQPGICDHHKYKFWLHPMHPNYYTERAKWLPFLRKLDPTGERKLIELYGDL